MPLHAQELSVCVDAYTRLDGDTVRVFEEELQGIARKSGLSLRFLQNQSHCPEIRIRIQAQGQKEVSALGATRVLNGRIQPELEIYVTPVATLIRSSLPVLLGRAMARVAAHEIGHYLLQESDHSDGLMSESFTAAHLLVKDHRSFRIPLATYADARRVGR